MKINLSVDISPFPVPQCLHVVAKPGRRQDGLGAAQSVAYGDLSREDLGKLCDEFKQSVMRQYQAEIDARIREADPTGY